jgi:hypothetical protein
MKKKSDKKTAFGGWENQQFSHKDWLEILLSVQLFQRIFLLLA